MSNYVFILCDQLRADFLPAYGCGAIRTPHIDRLASDGIVYENAVSAYPICVPARASMLVGQTPLESGVLSNHHWLRPDREAQGVHTWPALMTEQGWHTAAVGKMHFHPWESTEGFCERIIAEDKRWPLIEDDYADYLRRHGLSKFESKRHPDYQKGKGAITFPDPMEMVSDIFVGKSAASFIRSQKAGRPFALMVGFPGPHDPYDPCEESLARVDVDKLPPMYDRPQHSPAQWDRLYHRFLDAYRSVVFELDYGEFTKEDRLRVRHHYAALIGQIDDAVGDILDALESSGMLEKTTIIFTSDHGDFVGDLGMVGKGLFYRPSVHVPLIVRPAGGRRGGSRIRVPVELSQVPATMLKLAGALSERWSYPPLAAVTSAGASEPERPIFGVLGVGDWVQAGNWKLTRYQVGFGELFDLESDPFEQQNRWGDPACANVREEMEQALNHWILEQAVRGHQDKILNRGKRLCTAEEFGVRGWQRRYPQTVS